MYGEINALMHLCAMALKIAYILNSNYPLTYHIDPLKVKSRDIEATKVKQFFLNLIRSNYNIYSLFQSKPQEKGCPLTGISCSDFSYETVDVVADLQMSNSSQFHLSNLLLLTMTEETIREKKFMPLW